MAQRILGNNDNITLAMRSIYAQSLFFDAAATLDDFREAVETLADAERIARRVMGGAHPTTKIIEEILKSVRATLRAREWPNT